MYHISSDISEWQSLDNLSEYSLITDETAKNKDEHFSVHESKIKSETIIAAIPYNNRTVKSRISE